MTNKNFEIILEECITRLQAGESVPAILATYPQLADRLQPLLYAAAHGRDLSKPQPSREARAAGRDQVIAAWWLMGWST